MEKWVTLGVANLEGIYTLLVLRKYKKTSISKADKLKGAHFPYKAKRLLAKAFIR